MSKKTSKKKSTRHRPSPKPSPRRFLNNPLVLIGMVAALALVIWLLVSFTGGNAGGLSSRISVDEAYSMYQDGAFLLDVREDSEWDEYHVPGTTHIPLGELAARVDELPRDRQIVVVCRSGNRSQEGRDILLNAGFTQVTSMDDGLKTWRSRGYPIE